MYACLDKAMVELADWLRLFNPRTCKLILLFSFYKIINADEFNLNLNSNPNPKKLIFFSKCRGKRFNEK